MHPTFQEALAIEQFILNVTIPIFVETEGRAKLHATGTLFEIAGRQFIITARHIFEDLPDLTKMAFPENPRKGKLYTLGSFRIAKPKQEHIDIAVMELQSEETIAKLKANWKFLRMENVELPSTASFDGVFFLSGYPTSLTKIATDEVQSMIVTAYTQRISYDQIGEKYNANPELDLFFEYGHTATSITGEEIETPELRGLSGASVWEYKPNTSTIWAPESNTRVVGVQSHYLHSKCFLAKNWWAVGKVLEMIDYQLAKAVRSELH